MDNGSGSGYGSGYGYGSGSGSGDGDGYGSGDGYFDAILEPRQRRRPALTFGFWRSTEDGRPANGGDGAAVRVGLVQEIPGPLVICTSNALHATKDPKKWKGARWWVVALHKPVQRRDDKMGSLKREIIADLGICPFFK